MSARHSTMAIRLRRPVRYFGAWCILLIVASLLFLLSGCSKEMIAPAVSLEPVLTKHYRQGSVTVIVSASETNISVAGTIQLMLDVHAPTTSEVIFPDIGSYTDPFEVAEGYSEPVQVLPSGKHLHRRVWTLIPSLPGEMFFQPLEISAGSVLVKTDPIKVRVTSLLPQNLDTFEIKDIAGQVALLPEERRKQTLWLILLTGAGVIILLSFLIKQIRRPKEIAVPTPHEAASLALENLPDDALEKIQALTKILLTFIGGRFNLPTSASTVHEILPLLPEILPPERYQPLEEYLLASDQIRFSNKMRTGFADALDNYVRMFVEELKEEPCD